MPVWSSVIKRIALVLTIFQLCAYAHYQSIIAGQDFRLVQSAVIMWEQIMNQQYQLQSRLPLPANHIYHRMPELQKKPSIHFIFCEAYGSVCFLREDMKHILEPVFQTMDSTLKQHGWFVSSTLSQSPVMGGRSWLGYTTALSGINTGNQIQYDALITSPTPPPNIPSILRKEGYYTLGMSTLKSDANLSDKIRHNAYTRYWNYNTWYLYPDFHYGTHIENWYGGLHDQFAFGWLRDSVLPFVSAPVFTFFITISSHYPYFAPPPFMKHWQDLEHYSSPWPAEERWLDTMHMGPRYAACIQYTLHSIYDHILHFDNKEDIFVLIGDHQPAALDYQGKIPELRAATPVHIITRDSAFIRHINQVGFQPGVLPSMNPHDVILHESIMSRFLKAFYLTYGSSTKAVDSLQIYPEGWGY
jgi:phosphoglycerol transferase MdoB-like AlkP superfamily enzyme